MSFFIGGFIPEYLYQNPETQEIKSVFQKMTDEHIFIDENGLKWDRLWQRPQAQISSISNIDPNDSKSFVDVTRDKKGNVGDLFDLSKELSDKRKSKEGIDKIEIQSNENYKKTHRGRELPQFRKQKAKDILEKSGFELDL